MLHLVRGKVSELGRVALSSRQVSELGRVALSPRQGFVVRSRLSPRQGFGAILAYGSVEGL